MPSPEKNAIVALLRKSRRHLGPEDVVAVLGAISQVGEGPFSLRELRKYLPERIVSKRNVMRSVGALLQTLVSIGYLERFSERRYRKRYESFSHYLMSQRELAAQIATIDEVYEVHLVSGQWDMILKVRASSTEEVGRLVIDRLRTMKSIARTETCFVFDTVKEVPSLT